MHSSPHSATCSQKIRHFLTVADLSRDDIIVLIRRAIELKDLRARGFTYIPASGKVLGLVFEKPSTRTRISFETAMFQLGGNVSFMPSRDLQLRRGEPVRDTARVLSRYLDCIVVRTFGQEVVEEMARWSAVPVINGLTDLHHPCQILSDLMTVMEIKGPDLADLRVAWVGDGNNVAHSWIQAAAILGFTLILACPESHRPDPILLSDAISQATSPITVTEDPEEAVRHADVINTDVWASMGQEEETLARRKVFAPYQVNAGLVGLSRPDSIVLHCLPAHREEEITEDVLEGRRSCVWAQAENKMHLHKALLEWAMGLGPCGKERSGGI